MILATHGIIANSRISQVSPILDTYTGSAGAFSIYKERTAYSGSCIRVRRSSDNSESDIGFVGNYIDTSSLLSFVGANDGFVTTFYDQSGNSRNLTQSTATFQPKIVSSGSLNTSGGIATIVFDGTNDYLRNNALGSLYSGGNTVQMSSYWVGDFTSTNLQDIYTLGYSGTSTGLELWRPLFTDTTTNTSNKRDNSGQLKAVSGSSAITGQQFMSLNFNGTLMNVYKNGNQIINNGDINLGNTTLDNLAIGALIRSSIGSYSAIKIQQLFLWNTNESANIVDVNTLIKSRYGL